MYWGKVNESNPEDPVKKAQFFNGETKSIANRFSMDDDFTLVIQDVQVADEGKYSCQFVKENSDDSTNFTNLIVNGKLLDFLIVAPLIFFVPLSLILYPPAKSF